MSGFQRFEDIEAWQKARELTKQIYALSNDGKFARDFGLRDQIRRASVSIMSNIAEGLGRCGNKEFMQFLSTDKGFASEVQAQLYDFTQSTGNMIGGLIRYLSKSGFRGVKYER